ncbi:hypothetical protein TNCV_2283901 [Trichonephila clavipes]|nr:hypothetical protein TNCV_2283901 [Trichonephila clavipes]
MTLGMMTNCAITQLDDKTRAKEGFGLRKIYLWVQNLSNRAGLVFKPVMLNFQISSLINPGISQIFKREKSSKTRGKKKLFVKEAHFSIMFPTFFPKDFLLGRNALQTELRLVSRSRSSLVGRTLGCSSRKA